MQAFQKSKWLFYSGVVAHFSLVFALVANWLNAMTNLLDMECNSSYLLHLGMDGPNANLKFQNDLKTHLWIHRSEREFPNYQSIFITSLSICMVSANCLVPDIKIIVTKRI